jgi:hypothetical protein
MEQTEIRKLIGYIETNLRSSEKAGLKFVDTRNFNNQLNSRQNHVVFGRRGAGKTSLLKSIRGSADSLDIYVNLEKYKNITFPNILISVLIAMFEGIEIRIAKKWPCYNLSAVKPHQMKREISTLCSRLNTYLHQPDVETQEITTTESTSKQAGLAAEQKGVKLDVAGTESNSTEIKRALPKNKLDYLRLELNCYEKVINQVDKLFGNIPIYLILDDFYFVDKKIQPDLIDYFHIISKDTGLYIKLATIKYRSKLYRRTESQYTGVEIGADILGIDMDYTLDKFEYLKQFMHDLLTNAITASTSKVTIDDMFEGDGFSQLCLASGGVPRDFLSLFISLGNLILVTGNKIGKIDVNTAAIKGITSKYESMKIDSRNDSVCLEEYLDRIRKYVFNEKRTNCFLISKDELDDNQGFKQAIRELVDLRLVHLVDENTSKAPSDGKRYEAYIIDIGLYDNPKPQAFQQIEPGQKDEKSRKDLMRSSPVVSWLIMNGSQSPSTPLPQTNNKSAKKIPECQSQLDLSFE